MSYVFTSCYWALLFICENNWAYLWCVMWDFDLWILYILIESVQASHPPPQTCIMSQRQGKHSNISLPAAFKYTPLLSITKGICDVERTSGPLPPGCKSEATDQSPFPFTPPSLAHQCFAVYRNKGNYFRFYTWLTPWAHTYLSDPGLFHGIKCDPICY